MGPSPETENIARELRATMHDGHAWPRITLVTAVYNGARYIEDTIRSIIDQGYPNLEYIVVDGVSTDGTLDIIRKYEHHISSWVSQPDKGMYDALNTGFARSSGEIMGWLNASDVLHRGALFVVGSVFNTLPQVLWITGRPTRINNLGMTMEVGSIPHWARYRFLFGFNRYIQQESTFWRRSLWDQAGGYVDPSRRDASDFELWVRFFRHAPLYPVNTLIGAYRDHSDSIVALNPASYDRACVEIIENELNSMGSTGTAIRLFRRVARTLHGIPILRGIWWHTVMRHLNGLYGFERPPVIEDDHGKWIIRK